MVTGRPKIGSGKNEVVEDPGDEEEVGGIDTSTEDLEKGRVPYGCTEVLGGVHGAQGFRSGFWGNSSLVVSASGRGRVYGPSTYSRPDWYQWDSRTTGTEPLPPKKDSGL